MAEAAALVISVSSVISIFQSCVHTYKALNNALGMQHAVEGMDLELRIEEMKLRIWGRGRGICDDINEETESVVVDPDLRAVQLRHDDVLHIPGMRPLIYQTLKRMYEVLASCRQLAEKYVGSKTAIPATEVEQESASAPSSNGNLVAKTDKRSKFARLQDKFRWAARDRQVFREMLKELTSLNNGLGNLLPRDDTDALFRSLVSEIIHSNEDLKTVIYASVGDSKVSTVLRLRQNNMTNLSESIPLPPAETPAGVTDTETSQYLISISSFPDFEEPRVSITPGSNTPNFRSLHDYQPPTGPEPESRREKVLIEWRSRRAESEKSKISADELARRYGHIVCVLQQTAASSDEYRILNCLGFCRSYARLPDGSAYPIVGFVYRLPVNAASHAPPITLRKVIGDAFASAELQIPNLEDRYHLARALATSLHQLHCAGWIHRKFSSYNILFFFDKANGKVNVKRPYLCGWQYARPDGTDATMDKLVSEGTTLAKGDLDMYVHPARLHRNEFTGVPRFRKSYDIYSLGVVLMEIAFWEPIIAFTSLDDRKKIESFLVRVNDYGTEWTAAMHAAAEEELGPEMGTPYRDAVLSCLNDLRRWDRDDAGIEVSDLKNMDLEIEREFYWRVVDKLYRMYKQ
jgi:hypothetical protein